MLGRKILRPNKNQFIMKRRLPEGGFRFSLNSTLFYFQKFVYFRSFKNGCYNK